MFSLKYWNTMSLNDSIVFQAINVVVTSIPHTRGSIEATRDLSHAGLVNIKNIRISQPSSKVFFRTAVHPYYMFKKSSAYYLPSLQNSVPAVEGRTNVCGRNDQLYKYYNTFSKRIYNSLLYLAYCSYISLKST